MPAASHWLVCPLGLTSNIFTGLFWMNACSLHWFLYRLCLTSNIPKGLFLINACSHSLVCMPFRSHFWYLYRPVFNERLQHFIGFYACYVSLPISWQAYFQWMSTAFHWFVCPFGLTSDIFTGLFFQWMPAAFLWFLPFRSHIWYLYRLVFYECLQHFIGLYAF